MKKELKYIITGLPRSGTGYMSMLFLSAGVSCGHEKIFNFGRINENSFLEADSSWTALPYLKDFSEKKIIHITRNPLKVINSMYNKDIFRKKGETSSFIMKQIPELSEMENLLDKYIYFWVKWNEKIEEYAQKKFKVEDITANPRGFLSLVGIDIKYNILFAHNDYNRGSRNKAYTIKDLKKSKLYPMLEQKANKYNYSLN